MSDARLLAAMRFALSVVREEHCPAMNLAIYRYRLDVPRLYTDPRLAALFELVDRRVAGEPKRDAIRAVIAVLEGEQPISERVADALKDLP